MHNSEEDERKALFITLHTKNQRNSLNSRNAQPIETDNETKL